jgi:hypothetical protein
MTRGPSRPRRTCSDCASCRDRLRAATPRREVDALWDGLAAELDAPRTSLVERLLLRLGVHDHLARLLAATPALSWSWIAAVSAALGFAVGAAHLGGSDAWLLVFLGAAPLVPIAGVAAAYGPGIDPGYEIGVAAPMSGWRLLQLRTAAVLAVSVVLGGLATLALPQLGWIAVAWLLPGLAATSLTIALGTLVPARWAAMGVGVLWLGLVATAARSFAAPLAVLAAPTQVTCAVVAVAAMAVTVARRRTFDLV